MKTLHGGWPFANQINTSFSINWDHPIADGLRGFVSASDRVPIERVTGQISSFPTTMDYGHMPQVGRMWKPSTVGWAKFNILPWNMAQGCLAVWAHAFQGDFSYPCFACYGENNSNNIHMDYREWELWPRTDWNGTTLQLTDGNPDDPMNSPDAFLYAFSWYGGSGGTAHQIRDGAIADSGTLPDDMVVGTPTDWYFTVGHAFNDLYPMDSGYVGDVYLWDRYVTPGEIKTLHDYPWILYKPAVPSVAPKTTVTVQFLRPESDISDGNWTPSTGIDLYATIDEVTADDNDYDVSAHSPSSDTFEVQLSDGTDPSASDGHIIRYRYKKHGSETVNLTFYLMEGATQRDTWSHNDIPSTITAGQRTLSTAVADSITDYTNLRIRVTANVS